MPSPYALSYCWSEYQHMLHNPTALRRTFANSRPFHCPCRLPGNPQGGVGGWGSGGAGICGCVLIWPRGARGDSLWAARLCSRAFVIHGPQHQEKQEAMCSSKKHGLWPPDMWLPGPAPFLQTWETFVSMSASFQHISLEEYSLDEDLF